MNQKVTRTSFILGSWKYSTIEIEMNHRNSLFIVLWFTILLVDDYDHDQASAGCRCPRFPGFQNSCCPSWDSWFSSQTNKYGGQDENKDVRLKRREREPQRSSMARMSTSWEALIMTRCDLINWEAWNEWHLRVSSHVK